MRIVHVNLYCRLEISLLNNASFLGKTRMMGLVQMAGSFKYSLCYKGNCSPTLLEGHFCDLFKRSGTVMWKTTVECAVHGSGL